MTLRIDIDQPDHFLLEETWAGLRDAQDPQHPRVLSRGGSLVTAVDGGLQPWTVDSLIPEISKSVEYFRTRQTQQGPVQAPVKVAEMRAVVRQLLAQHPSRLPGALPVERVATAPFVSGEWKRLPGGKEYFDGGLVTRSGYDAASQTYLELEPRLEDLPIPETVEMWDQVQEAEEVLNDYLHDFRFRDEPSRANALALMLLPFMRGVIGNRPTPMHTIVSSQPGTGKSWLADTLMIPFVGDKVSVQAEAESDAEWRKRITTFLMQGKPAILIDNVHAKLESAALANVLTTTVWEDRRLGSNEVASIPMNCVWIATANNPDFSAEMTRRLCPIMLDPGTIRLVDRHRSSLRHPDLLDDVRSDRRRILIAILTLVRHWLLGPVADHRHPGPVIVRKSHVHGDEYPPLLTDKTFASYGRYARVMDGVLSNWSEPLGAAFLANRDQVTDTADEAAVQACEFVLKMREVYGAAPVRYRQIADDSRSLSGPLYGALPDHLMGLNEEKLRERLGTYLRRWKDVPLRTSVGPVVLRKTQARSEWRVYTEEEM